MEKQAGKPTSYLDVHLFINQQFYRKQKIKGSLKLIALLNAIHIKCIGL